MNISTKIQTTIYNQPTVSVIIPTFNREHLIQRTISSVLAQTFSDLELIIVDDGSTDNTGEVIQKFTDPRIRYIPLDKNYGGGYARNQGIKAAHGELIAFLDSDDEWMPEKLELQIARLRANDNPFMTVVYCIGYEYYESIKRQKLPKLDTYEGDVFDYLLRGWLPPTASLFMVKRSALIGVGGFDESLPSFQDYDLWLRLAEANNHFIAVNKPLVIRYFHREQIGGDVSANLAGFEIFKDKWSKTIQQRLGFEIYYQVMGIKTSIIQLKRIGKAVDDGQRITALLYSLTLCKFLPWSKNYLITGLIVSLFGHNAYRTFLQAKSTINAAINRKKISV